MNKHLRLAILLISGTFVLIPILLLFLWAFSTSWMYPDFLPELSFSKFNSYWNSGRIQPLLINSIILSTMVSILSFFIGIIPAKYFATKEFKFKTFLYIVLLIPAITPGICIMFGLMGVLINLGIYKTYIGLLLAQVTFTTPYFIFTMIPIFKRYDTQLDEQSYVLGVGKSSTLLNVTLPSVKSGLANSFMLCFVISWSMYLITDVAAPKGFKTMAMDLLPQLSAGYATDSFVAITALIFLIPAFISLLISTGDVASDKINSKENR